MRSILLRKLYHWIFTEYHDSKDWKSQCTLVFVDELGRKYYRYVNQFDMPVGRTIYLDNLKYQYSLSWGVNEQEELEKRMTSVINSVIDQRPFSKYSAKALDVQKLLKLKDARKGRVIPVDILHEIMACYLIREDEEPSQINEADLPKKVECLFKKKGTAYWLKKLALSEVLGLSEITDEQLETLLQQSKAMDEKTKEVLNLTTD